MSRFRTSLPLLVAALAFCTASQAVPTRLSAAAGEVVHLRYASGSGNSSVFYAATQGGGVYKSTNGGQSWAITGLNKGYVWKVAVSPLTASRVYAATDAGLFRTDDAGTTWTQLTYDPAKAVAVDPGSSGADTVLLGVTGQGIFGSTNNGVTFNRHSAGLDSLDPIDIQYRAPSIAFALLDCNYQDTHVPYGEGNWGGLFIATNANAAAPSVNWSSYQNGGGGTPLPSKCVRAMAMHPSTSAVYVGIRDPFTATGAVYVTTGAGWSTPGGGADQGNITGVLSLAVDRNSPTTKAFAGGDEISVWVSNNTGANWCGMVNPPPFGTPAQQDPDMFTAINALETVPGLADTVLAAPKGLGVFRTGALVGGCQFNWDLGTGIAADRVRALANHSSAAPNTFWMALEQGGVMKSTNAGASWASWIALFGSYPNSLVPSAQAIAADPNNAGVVVVGVRQRGLYRLNTSLVSLDGDNNYPAGTAWVQDSLPSSVVSVLKDHNPQSLAFAPGSSTAVYYTLFDAADGNGAGGLLRSASGPAGLTQTQYPDVITSCAVPATATPDAYKVVPISGNRVFLLRHDSVPYRSANGFADNSAACVAAPSVGHQRLAFFDIAENPSSADLLVAATNKGIFRSFDGGLNWGRLDITGPAYPVMASVAYAPNGVLWGADRSGGLYCSTSDGTFWLPVSLGTLPAVSFREVKVLNGLAYVLTDGGGIYTGFPTTCP